MSDDKLFEYLKTAVGPGEDEINRAIRFLAYFRITYPNYQPSTEEAAILWILLRYRFEFGGSHGALLHEDISDEALLWLIPPEITVARDAIRCVWTTPMPGGLRHEATSVAKLVATCPALFRDLDVYAAVDVFARIAFGVSPDELVPVKYVPPEPVSNPAAEPAKKRRPKKEEVTNQGEARILQ